MHSSIMPNARAIYMSIIGKPSLVYYFIYYRIGTEAAAVTGVTFDAVSFPLEFKVNRPFIVLINEHITGTILFMGRVCSPLAKKESFDITSASELNCENSFSGNGQ